MGYLIFNADVNGIREMIDLLGQGKWAEIVGEAGDNFGRINVKNAHVAGIIERSSELSRVISRAKEDLIQLGRMKKLTTSQVITSYFLGVNFIMQDSDDWKF